MENENEKLNITLTEGLTSADVTIRHGDAPPQLPILAPVKTQLSGTVGSVNEYLGKRVSTGQFTQERSHLLVDREDIKLTLVINEDEERQRGTVSGKLEFHPAFVSFGINNPEKVWTPTELGMFVKMNRAFFSDRAANMALVTALMNFKATVDNKIERSVKENGDRTDNFAQIVNSNLPKSFMLNIPIFKGMPAEMLEVETFARINGREVAFVLLSSGAQETLESLRDQTIDAELKKIREIAPNIAIIEQ
jgi:hypothetical protein